MIEKIRIFENDKINKLEDSINDFILDIDIVPLAGFFNTYLHNDKAMYVYMLSYQLWEEGEISPKKKKGWKYKQK